MAGWDYLSMLMNGGKPSFNYGEQMGPSLPGQEQYGPGMADLMGKDLPITGTQQANPMAMLSLMGMMQNNQEEAPIGAPSMRGIAGAAPKTNFQNLSQYQGAPQQVNPYASLNNSRRRMPLGLMNFLGR